MKTVIATTTGFHLRHLALELVRAGTDVQYFSSLPRFRLARDGISADWSESAFLSLLPTSALALARQLPSGVQSRAVEAMLTRMDDHVARHLKRCDAFIGLSSMAVRSAARARALGAKVLIERGSRHVLSQDRLIRAGGGKGLSPKYVERELASYAEADIVTVLSRHSAESFVEEGFPRERLFVCPLGVDLTTFKPTPRPSSPLKLLFVGGWSSRKGADLLVKAVRRHPGWSVTHAGTIGDVPFPQGAAQFRSIGHQNHAALQQVMADHHALVLPSREDGFGMVLLEALASGLPVVASYMTGAPDIRTLIQNPDWVELVKAGDLDDLDRGITELAAREAAEAMSNEPGSLRERLTLNDREKLGWSAYAKRYSDFLTDLVGRGIVR